MFGKRKRRKTGDTRTIRKVSEQYAILYRKYHGRVPKNKGIEYINGVYYVVTNAYGRVPMRGDVLISKANKGRWNIARDNNKSFFR